MLDGKAGGRGLDCVVGPVPSPQPVWLHVVQWLGAGLMTAWPHSRLAIVWLRVVWPLGAGQAVG